jgi:hypothetical protein
MEATGSYLAAAQAYADAVRVLFAPPGAPTGERGRRGPASFTDLAGQAERLSSLSAQLTQSISAQLEHPAAPARAQASIASLAKALTDLEVSAYVLQAAVDEEEKVAWARSTGSERSVVRLGPREQYLLLLLGGLDHDGGRTERRGNRRIGAQEARTRLSVSIGDALDLVRERATKTGQAAFEGLLGLGVAEVAMAAGLLGTDIADAIGQAEKVTRLYVIFRDFAFRSYGSVIALFGQPLAQEAAQHVLEWVDDLRNGRLLGELVEKLYETEQTGHDLRQLTASSQAGREQFLAAIEGIHELETSYGIQTSLADKLLRGFRFLGGVPAAALPQGKLLVAAAYIVLGAYVVLAGADYVDAKRLKLLDRVPGVRQVVETKLIAA